MIMGIQGERNLEIWGGIGAGNVLDKGDGVVVHDHFRKTFRRLQAFRLYRELRSRHQPMIVTTAGSTDFLLASHSGQAIDEPGQVVMVVHWFRMKQGRMKWLSRIARKHPGLSIAVMTSRLKEIFQDAGFIHVRQINYPSQLEPAKTYCESEPHLLVAGAARMDKGLPHVVDLVQRYAEQGRSIALKMQVSTPNHPGKIGQADHGRHPTDVQHELDRLRRIGYEPLELIEHSMGQDEYRGLFPGSIVLQPYDRNDFFDRVSGITLDALAAGAPVITTSDTWLGRMTDRFDCGVTMEKPSGESLESAIDMVLSNLVQYRSRASEAGMTLASEHGAAGLVEHLADPNWWQDTAKGT